MDGHKYINFYPICHFTSLQTSPGSLTQLIADQADVLIPSCLYTSLSTPEYYYINLFWIQPLFYSMLMQAIILD